MRYVVFEQEKDETGRVNRIVGPFTKWERANEYVTHMNKNANPDDRLWYGIRELESTSIMRMS